MLAGTGNSVLAALCSAIRTLTTLNEERCLVYGGKGNHHDSPIMFEGLFAQSGLSLERLKTFLEIVAAGGISAAAGDDSNRQSQYSRQLKELERCFGVELLKRGRGPVELTDAGQQLYEIVGHTLQALEEFRATCAGQPTELVIGAGESLIQWLLLPRLSGLAAAHPRLGVTFQNLKTDEILQRLLDGGVDFGVVTRHEPHRALASAPLGKMEFRLFAPAGLLPANHRLKVKSDILGHLPLATLEGSPGIRQAIEQEAQRIGIKLNVRLRFSSYPQLAQAVRNLGVAAIMPKLAVASFEDTDVRAVPLGFLGDLSRQVALVWNRKMAEVRPAIAKYSRSLPAMFRMVMDDS
jgi:DNA-binding transcriptional LysR family regulator